MNDVAFYVEEILLAKFIEKISDNQKNLNEFLSLAEHASDLKMSQIFLRDDFLSLEVNGIAIAQFLYERETNGDLRDLIVRLEILLAHSEACEISNDPTLGSGLLSLKNGGRGGLLSTEEQKHDWWDPRAMFLAIDNAAIIRGLRQEFLIDKNSLQDLCDCAHILFPNLYFHVPLSDFRKTGLDYIQFLDVLFRHLSYLNDEIKSEFENGMGDHVIIANAAAKSVEISPESRNTHKNKSAMAERNIYIGSKKICCEWHTKFTYNKGRIHFYPWPHQDKNINNITKEKVIIGIITDHLTC